MLDWFWTTLTVVKVLILVLLYALSGGLASFIYTVRTLRRYPDQTKLDDTDREGLIPVVIFSPIVLLYYLAISFTIPYKGIVWLAENYTLKDREKRQLAEKRKAENERLASMSSEERMAELNRMIDEMNSESGQFLLPEAKTEFIPTPNTKRKAKVAVQ